MKNEDYLNRSYIQFKDFLRVAITKELEYFVLDAKFTSFFNYKVKEIVNEIGKDEKRDVEGSVIFNTEGAIALIDAGIIGDFIKNNYIIAMEKYYKLIHVDKVIKNIQISGDKSKIDFIKISYSILYKTIEELYQDIIYKKEIKDKYIKRFRLEKHLDKDLDKDVGEIVLILLILEDICKYLKIDLKILYRSINKIILSENI